MKLAGPERSLLASTRSWSISPPPYADGDDHTSDHRPLPLLRRASSRSHAHFSRWFMTFEKQWLLIHSVSIFACFATMFAGAALFVTFGLGDNFDDVHRVWLATAMGMIGLMMSIATFKYLLQVYRSNSDETDEQRRTNKFLATSFAALAQTFVAVIYIAMTCTIPSHTYKMKATRSVVTVAATSCLITAVYDVVKLCRDGSGGDHEDHQYAEDDITDDILEHIDVNLGPVRIE